MSVNKLPPQHKAGEDALNITSNVHFLFAVIVPTLLYMLGFAAGVARWINAPNNLRHPIQMGHQTGTMWMIGGYITFVGEILIICDLLVLPIVWTWCKILYPLFLWRVERHIIKTKQEMMVTK